MSQRRIRQTMAHGPSPLPPAFVKKSFNGTQLLSLTYELSMADFALQLQSWTVTAENIRPTKPKIFTI